MGNPHYQRLSVTHRKFLGQGSWRWAWVLWLIMVGLVYWLGSIEVFISIPIALYALIGILSIETARFVANDRHQPAYEATLLTPITAETIVDGYRQMSFVRTERWFGLPYRQLFILVGLTYLILAQKMYLLIHSYIHQNVQPNPASNFIDDQTITMLVVYTFMLWGSLLFGTLTYYLLAIDVSINLGLKFDDLVTSFISGLFTMTLIMLSSFVVVSIATAIAATIAYFIVGLFMEGIWKFVLAEQLPYSAYDIIFSVNQTIIFIVFFCVYPLRWRSLFRRRAKLKIHTLKKD